MTAFKLLGDSIASIFGNLTEALQISGLLWIALLALEITLDIVFGPAGGALGVALLVAANLVAGIWIAVAWHRFLILGERPEGYTPAWQGPMIAKYFYASLTVVVALVGVGVVVISLFMAMPATITPGGQFIGMAVFAPLIAGLLVNYLLFRLSPVFPAAALGKTVRLRDAWTATRPLGKACFGLALIAGIGVALFQGIMAEVSGTSAVAALLVELVLGWVLLMLSVSIMTTIYKAVAPEAPQP